MADVQTTFARATPEALPDNITSIQPGGGKCMALELAWGGVRRWWLRTFRPGYLRRMAQRRQGDVSGCPHEVLDPRDLKYYRNQCDGGWQASDDPFRWRNHLLLARWGLGELLILGVPLLALTVLAGYLFWPLAIAPLVVLVWWVSFFRDPPRRIPTASGLIVSPADGKVTEITPLDHDEFIGGPAVRIGIFLSIFNVHINRAPVRSRVVRLRYWPGKFLNALNPASSWENESLWLGLEEEDSPHRRMIVRQVSGLLARRIVCDVRPGEVLERGYKFGMIKLGSRTELILPAGDDLRISTTIGQPVRAGATILGQWSNSEERGTHE